MNIDWSKAPEGTTHAMIADGEVHWRREFDDRFYAWCDREGWQLLGGTSDYWKAVSTCVEKPSLTIQQLSSLVQESGLQLEFHANGNIYVWDGVYAESTRVNSLEEYIRLAEAKAAYVKLRADYKWE